MNRKKILRLAAEFAALVVLEVAGLYAMAWWRVMEVILAPGPHSQKVFVALAVMFVVTRAFLLVAAPGWFLARLVLLLTAPRQLAVVPGVEARPAPALGGSGEIDPQP
jgi:hypothetical protein